jgi:hypothetical protein
MLSVLLITECKKRLWSSKCLDLDYVKGWRKTSLLIAPFISFIYFLLFLCLIGRRKTLPTSSSRMPLTSSFPVLPWDGSPLMRVSSALLGKFHLIDLAWPFEMSLTPFLSIVPLPLSWVLKPNGRRSALNKWTCIVLVFEKMVARLLNDLIYKHKNNKYKPTCMHRRLFMLSLCLLTFIVKVDTEALLRDTKQGDQGAEPKVIIISKHICESSRGNRILEAFTFISEIKTWGNTATFPKMM